MKYLGTYQNILAYETTKREYIDEKCYGKLGNYYKISDDLNVNGFCYFIKDNTYVGICSQDNSIVKLKDSPAPFGERCYKFEREVKILSLEKEKCVPAMEDEREFDVDGFLRKKQSVDAFLKEKRDVKYW